MKIISWNVNGVRAWHKKESLSWVLSQNPDIFCLQEMKAREEQLPPELKNLPGYTLYMDYSKNKKGYSGVAVYVKTSNPSLDSSGKLAVLRVDTELHVDNPSILKSVLKNDQKNSQDSLPSNGVDHEGRFIALYFNDFILINCYFPNGGGDEARLRYKLNFYNSFLEYLKTARDNNPDKRIVFCGDVNVAHTEIDIARPKENQNHVGFLPVERAWVDTLIGEGFIDMYRELNPGKKDVYTWWDLKTFARDRNIGWRIDYFFVDRKTQSAVSDVLIHSEIQGSDHCPLSLVLEC